MEFNPANKIVQMCLKGIALEENGALSAAQSTFRKALEEASNDFEKFVAAFYVGRTQQSVAGRLEWFETALQYARASDNDSARTAYATLYERIADCYEETGDKAHAAENHNLAERNRNTPLDPGPFYHGTRADLQVGDELIPGFNSNYKDNLLMNHIYFTAMVNGAGLAASLAKGEGRERIYVVVPTGSFENDPNVTDKKFPGNLTRSYRTTQPLKIVGEVPDWARQTPEDLQKWRERLANNQGDIIN